MTKEETLNNEAASFIDELPPLTNNEREQDNLYNIMLRSLQDAVDIANKLGGMVDANRIGITLFIARSKTNPYGC